MVLKAYTDVTLLAIEGVVFQHFLHKFKMSLLNFSTVDIKDLNLTFITFIQPHKGAQIMFE